jgi:hypothetical protein
MRWLNRARNELRNEEQRRTETLEAMHANMCRALHIAGQAMNSVHATTDASWRVVTDAVACTDMRRIR